MVENEKGISVKEQMEFLFFYHINDACQRDCPFCEDFHGSLRLIDNGYLEDYLAGNY